MFLLFRRRPQTGREYKEIAFARNIFDWLAMYLKLPKEL
jgi:hypothetical protein